MQRELLSPTHATCGFPHFPRSRSADNLAIRMQGTLVSCARPAWSPATRRQLRDKLNARGFPGARRSTRPYLLLLLAKERQARAERAQVPTDETVLAPGGEEPAEFNTTSGEWRADPSGTAAKSTEWWEEQNWPADPSGTAAKSTEWWEEQEWRADPSGTAAKSTEW